MNKYNVERFRKQVIEGLKQESVICKQELKKCIRASEWNLCNDLESRLDLLDYLQMWVKDLEIK